ncbi:MAG TPA: dihydrofolate reductase family protein [Ignavibacteriaceae bacterium]|nr:dihydrofolate reductase family protein [Ignavibacteriaceae bacterium]
MLNEVKSRPAGRKLKLQMQLSIDGFVAGLNGELDWMTWNWDDELKKYVGELTDSVDTILLGRKMTDGFISHWTNVAADSNNDEYAAARKFVDTPKIVFTKTLNRSNWINTKLAAGDIVTEVNKLKKQSGKDIIVYGGAGFVSSLVKNNLIDEYHLFINPTAIGKGMEIFKDLNEKLNLKLVNTKTFSNGVVGLFYERIV